MLLALGIPCSAQLATIMGILGGISFAAFLTLFGIVLGQLVLVGCLAAKVLPGDRTPFIMELPPLRVPQFRNVLTKTWLRVRWYLGEAVPLFLAGTALLFVLDRIGALAQPIAIARPVVTKLLGLPPEMAQVFVMGFLRRDYGAAGLYALAAIIRKFATHGTNRVAADRSLERSNRMSRLIIALVLAAGVAGCGPALEPVEISGADQCFNCRRGIGQARLAAEILDENARAFKFKSAGCLAAWLAQYPDEQPRRIYVADFNTGRLIRAERATFVSLEVDIQTHEHAYHAFASKAAAEQVARSAGETTVDWETIVRRAAEAD